MNSSKYCLNFNNGSATLTTSAITLGNTWTIESMVKFPLPTGYTWNTLTRGNNDHQIIVSSGLEIGMYDNLSNTGFHGTGYIVNKVSNGWHRLSITGHDNIQEYYIDGIKIGQTNFQSKTDIISIGDYQGGSQPFGFIDDFRVFNIVLTQDKINKWKDKIIPKSTPNLISYFTFDEGNGTLTKDIIRNINGTLSSVTWINSNLPYIYKGKLLIQDGNNKENTNGITLTNVGALPLTLNDFQTYGFIDESLINTTSINLITNQKYSIALYKSY